MAVHIIIPAHYESTRLPGKVLCDIAGKPMIQHVYERGKQARADQVIVATDNKQVFDAVKKFGGEVCTTATTHQSGTERIAEVINQLQLKDDDIVIGLQADEPLIPPKIIEQLINILKQKSDLSVATLCEPLDKIEEIFDPGITKLICDKKGFALYFSHAPMPWYRDGFDKKTLPTDFTYYRHIGMYGYRVEFVKRYINWPTSPIEKIEALEQLRILYYGEKIYVAIACEKPGPGVDTSADLAVVRTLLK